MTPDCPMNNCTGMTPGDHQECMQRMKVRSAQRGAGRMLRAAAMLNPAGSET